VSGDRTEGAEGNGKFERCEMTKTTTKAKDVSIVETYDMPGHATVEIRVSADVTKYQAAKALGAWLIKYMEATESWKKRSRWR